MIDLNYYINNLGKPDAIIDFNGKNNLYAGIWGFDEIIECNNGQVFLNGKLKHGDPLDILQETIDKWKINSRIFSAIGFFSYDFKNILFPHISFKSISTSIPQYWFGKPSKINIMSHFLIIELNKRANLYNKKSGLDRKQYYKLINKIKYHLEQGDVYQINQTYPLKFNFYGDPLNLYCQLSWKIRPRRGMFLNIGNQKILSFSPEEFIQVNNGKILSYPMKGTRPEGKNEVERQKQIFELSNSKKDKAEHLMIVDLLRNDLGKICNYGSVNINNLYNIQSYETVHHMVTEVYGQLKDKTNFIDIIKAIFPGGSVTGAPKEKSMKIIDQLEDYNRGIYTGTMGIIKPNGDMDFNILIRTLTIEKNKAIYPIGGGIVWDSESNQEWSESKTKSKILDYVISKMKKV